MLPIRQQFGLRALLLTTAGIAAMLFAGQVAWRYGRMEAAWRAFPEPGRLEWDDSASFLRPRYAIDLSANPGLRSHHLAIFAGLPTVSHIDLSGTPVNDQCLPHLKSMRNLRSVDLTGTQVSERGAEKLQEALPACAIHH